MQEREAARVVYEQADEDASVSWQARLDEKQDGVEAIGIGGGLPKP
jgi:hypothetical protein